jgi:hypothetical protein
MPREPEVECAEAAVPTYLQQRLIKTEKTSEDSKTPDEGLDCKRR